MIGHVIGDIVDFQAGELAHEALEQPYGAMGSQMDNMVQDFFGGMIAYITVVVIIVGLYVVLKTARGFEFFGAYVARVHVSEKS